MSLGAAMVRVGNRQQVGRACIARGERCRLRLDDQPHGNQVGGGNAGHALHDVGKFARFAIDERAAADVPLDHPVMRDRFDRPAHGVARTPYCTARSRSAGNRPVDDHSPAAMRLRREPSIVLATTLGNGFDPVMDRS